MFNTNKKKKLELNELNIVPPKQETKLTPKQETKLTPKQKIQRALEAQEIWGQRHKECEANLNKLQGEIQARVQDIMEDEGKTFEQVMQEIRQPQRPTQEQVIAESVEKTLKEEIVK